MLWGKPYEFQRNTENKYGEKVVVAFISKNDYTNINCSLILSNYPTQNKLIWFQILNSSLLVIHVLAHV